MIHRTDAWALVASETGPHCGKQFFEHAIVPSTDRFRANEEQADSGKLYAQGAPVYRKCHRVAIDSRAILARAATPAVAGNSSPQRSNYVSTRAGELRNPCHAERIANLLTRGKAH